MTPSEKTMCLDGFIRSFRWWGAFYLFATSVVGKADSKSLQQLLLNGCQIIRRYLGSQIIRRYLGSQIIQPILWEVNYFTNIMGSTSQKPPGSVFPTLLILNHSQLFQICKVTILWKWDLQTFFPKFPKSSLCFPSLFLLKFSDFGRILVEAGSKLSPACQPMFSINSIKFEIYFSMFMSLILESENK